MNRLKQLMFMVVLLIPISSHIEPKVFRAPADVAKHGFIYKTLLKVLDPATASGSVNVVFLDKLARDLYELVFTRDIDFIKDPYLTTALMISTLYSESRLRELSNHDSTNPNWCLMQINLGITASGGSFNRVIVREDGKYAISKHEGYDGPSLERDQRACLNVGLAFLKESWRMCSKYPESHRLSVYLSGSCFKSRRASTFRYQRALSLSETLMTLHMKDQLTRNTQVCYNTK